MEQDLFFDQEKGKIAINSMINNKFRYPPNIFIDKIKLSNNYIFFAGKSEEDKQLRIFKSDKNFSDILDLNKDQFKLDEDEKFDVSP
jgi:hypothetical protein